MLAGALVLLQLAVPEGYVVEKAAGEPAIRFPMFAAFDERGRLFVAESSGLDLYAELQALTRKCRVSVLEDRDGDGRFETARVFADRLVFPMGLAWSDGRLYVADPPELVAYDEAGRRTRILGDFGHTDNGSLHGLIFGPDGLLYMTMGMPDGYRLPRGDGTFLESGSGALIRCRPDGTEPEVLARGFDNLVEIVFTDDGERIGTDNWFVFPQGGVRDALVDVADGGLYPRTPDSGTPQPVTGEPLPGIALFPAVALSGLARWEETIVSAQHNARKAARHRLIAEGSTFRAEHADLVTSADPDFHPSDVLEDADGSLLVVDTGGWYVQHCPTGRIQASKAPGGIWRVRRAGAARPADPWGLAIDWAKADASLLADPRPAVRERAGRVLALRGAVAELARAGALWPLSTVPGEAASAALREALASKPAAAARALGVRRDRAAAAPLARLLGADAPAVRRAAADALARCGGPESLGALWTALAREGIDRFEEHAIVHAIHRLAGAAELEAALRDGPARARRAALLLLDQPPRPGLDAARVAPFLTAEEPQVRDGALIVLRRHPDWADAAAALADRWLADAAFDPDRLRSLLLAFQRQEPVQKRIAEGAADAALPAERRRFLIETMAATTLKSLPGSWIRVLDGALADDALRGAAVSAVATLQPTGALLDRVAAIAEASDVPVALRLAALRAVVPRRPRLSEASVAFLVARLDRAGDPVERMAAAEILARAAPAGVPLPDDPLIRGLLGTGAASGDAEIKARLEGYAPLLAGGDAARGRAVFFDRRVACSTCHRVGIEGGIVGPDLTRIGAIRSSRDLLESIVAPSSTFAQGYQPYRVDLADGSVVRGLIARQTDEVVVVRDSSGAETRLPRGQIADLRPTSVSVMPEGLDRGLKPDELRDLLAYLQSLQ